MKFTQTNRTIRDGLRRLKEWVDKQILMPSLFKHILKKLKSI